jgi:hypothetical protein
MSKKKKTIGNDGSKNTNDNKKLDNQSKREKPDRNTKWI